VLDADAIADLIAAIEPDKLVSEISRDERRDRFHHYLEAGMRASRLPPPWRRGRLLQQSIAWADANDIHKLTAEVMAHNTAAVALFQELGFAEEGYLVNHFRRKSGGANDAVLMSRTRLA
jgi:GNAT superfamily N-acetyltransferase